MTTRRKAMRFCSRCGGTYPATADYFYLYRSGPRQGRPTGFCKTCQRAYCRQYDHEITGPKLARRRIQQRDFQRRKEGYDPERYRVSIYEALLAEAPLPDRRSA